MDLNLKTSVLNVQEPLVLKSGKTIKKYELTYETYGKLNENKDNAVLVCHALSGNHHAAGKYDDEEKPGWWDNMIGPNKPINTDNLFVVSLNNLGGCHGSTGPKSINPETKKYYGSDFPIVTVEDWINSQKKLMEEFKISKWKFVIGGSLGGMQAFQWTIQYPDCVDKCIVIAACTKINSAEYSF